MIFFFFSSRRRHTRFDCDWSSDVCSSDLRVRGRKAVVAVGTAVTHEAAGPARVRREPRQARSRARVAQILAAADGILSQEGFEALTVRRIALEAGVPVGSIYQFFPDKAAVVDALAHGYIGEFDAAIARLVDGAE